MMVRSLLEYASPVWSPSTELSPFTEFNILKLEMVQRRAARFVMNDFLRFSSVSRMTEQLGWPTLKQRRTEAKVVMIYL